MLLCCWYGLCECGWYGWCEWGWWWWWCLYGSVIKIRSFDRSAPMPTPTLLPLPPLPLPAFGLSTLKLRKRVRLRSAKPLSGLAIRVGPLLQLLLLLLLLCEPTMAVRSFAGAVDADDDDNSEFRSYCECSMKRSDDLLRLSNRADALLRFSNVGGDAFNDLASFVCAGAALPAPLHSL